MKINKVKKEYIKPQIMCLRMMDNISLMCSSAVPSKQNIPFKPDFIPDAEEDSYAS